MQYISSEFYTVLSGLPKQVRVNVLLKLRNRYGFTLIELLIVVAIIGILAAIAIPRFSAYRVSAFNATAVSDLKNAKTMMESYFADNHTYPH